MKPTTARRLLAVAVLLAVALLIVAAWALGYWLGSMTT